MNIHFKTISQPNDLLPALKGRVFHATPASNAALIRESGLIIPNVELEYRSMFNSADNGFFRKRGYVSFFDYRKYGNKIWEEYAYKCFPTQILSKTRGDKISILFLHEDLYENLTLWTKWKDEEAWGDKIVPHIEAGYKGSVPLKHITEELIVNYKFSSITKNKCTNKDYNQHDG